MSLQAYGYIFQVGTESVPLNTNVNYSNNGPLLNIVHIPGTAPIVVGLAGIYNISLVVNTSLNNPAGFSIFVNGVSQANFVSGGQNLTALASLPLNAGDSITIRNTATSPDPAVLRTGTSVSSTVLINKVDA